jgi:hypothetical protein
MAQAVLAQAFARAGQLDLAKQAYAAIPGKLDLALPAGPWIRLYGGSSLVVLNAQLQSVISIGDYAQLAADAAAAAYADGLLATAKAMLPRFDTGYWSRYSLGSQSDLNHQDYVVSLLKMLGTRTGDPAWTDMADKIAEYETQPPALTGGQVTRIVYPRPLDGVRDDLPVRFWLSKPSRVLLVVDGRRSTDRGTAAGTPPDAAPPRLATTAGSRAERRRQQGHGRPGSFTVGRDTTPPTLSASTARATLYGREGPFSARCGVRLYSATAQRACCRRGREARRRSRRSIAPPAPRPSRRGRVL